ncbi:hypothetical protein NDU88_003638 [Pleurodeles waltl]|uniref:Uncharacterized protein n=1 Tax=Pleurodeles waltl TaxID=8319 RepID=A0AAV7V2C1_PLEWA|nr:hypothetical protein NDU88_003638 [Pleurodeles waltl]
MVKDKGFKVLQASKTINYAQLVQTEKEGDQGSKALDQGTEDPFPSLKDLMVAIQGSKTEVIPKLMQQQWRSICSEQSYPKLSSRVNTAEQEMVALQVEVDHLRATVVDLQKLINGWMSMLKPQKVVPLCGFFRESGGSVN